MVAFWRAGLRTRLLLLSTAIALGLLIPPGVAARAAAEQASAPIDGEGDPNSCEIMQIEWTGVEVGDEITATGTLGVYGNEPHAFLALLVQDDQPPGEHLVEITGDLEDELWDLQNRRVTVSGEVTRLEVGPGFPLQLRAAAYRELDG